MTPREFYAEEIEATCGLTTPALARAFATVPREEFVGPGLEPALGQAMHGFDFMGVRRLRRDPHEKEPACWLHGPDFCLSR